MKIFSGIYAGIIIAGINFFSDQAAAFFVPLNTLDPVTDAGNITNNLATVTNVVNTGLVDAAQKGIKNAKAKYDEYKDAYEGVYNKVKAPLDGSKEIKESTVADIHDPESIRLAIYNLFMAYPSNDEKERVKYTEKAQQFYFDTVNELYTSVRLLEQDYANNIKPRIEEMSTDMISGENGASSGDDENANWKNMYNTYKTMDDLIQVLEELTAMKAQYESAKAIKDVIRPAPAKEASAQSLIDNGRRFASASRRGGEVLAFGQYQEETDGSGYTYRYNPDTDGPVSFNEAPNPETPGPYDANTAALEDLQKLNPIYYKALDAVKVHNLMQSLPSKRRLFSQYDKFVRLHEKSVEAVKQSDQCVLDYLGRYYEDAENIWYGGYIGDQITDYDLRSGLSGWAINSYDTAKAAKNDEVDESAFFEIAYDKNIDNTDLTSIEKQKQTISTKANDNSGFATEGDKQKAEENAREAEVMAWEVGSEAAKMLAEDQYASQHKWGTPFKKFPIWNDVKSFYGQYLDGKYDNMAAYLRRLNFEAKIVALALELNKLSDADIKLKNLAASQLGQLSDKVSSVAEVVPLEETLDSTRSAKESDIEVLKKNKEAALRTLKKEEEKYVKELDEAMAEVNENTKALNRLRYPDLNSDNEPASGNLTEEDLEAAIKEGQNKVTEIQRKLDAVRSKIAEIENAYIQKEQAIEQKFSSKLSEMLEKIVGSSSGGVSIAPGDSTGLPLGYIGYVNGLLGSSTGIFENVKDYAAQTINKAKEDLYGMGDDLYLPQSSTKVVARHQQLINELRTISFAALSEGYGSVKGISGSEAAVNLVTTAFQSVLTSTLCSQYPCDKADDEYFVSSVGKTRDFTAPKASPNTPLAPIREVVRLDYVDYNNIPHRSNDSIARDAILNYGFPVPEIWNLMLKNPAYVEKDIDLEKALVLGGEQTTFMRGGILPCRSGNLIIDALDRKAGYYVVEDRDSPYRKCLALEAKGQLLGAGAAVTNLEIKKSVIAEYQREIAKGSPSELGVFLKYTDNKMFFGDIEQKTYKRVTEIMGESSQSEEYERNVPDEIYQKAEFSENQIGSFLRLMETEREYRQKVDEMKVKIDELQTEILDELRKSGFSPKDDFNLADDKDYNEALKALDSSKNARLLSAYSDLEEISVPENEVVADRIASIRNMLDAMTKDKDELLSVSQDTISDSELDEEIKREETNKAAADKYQKEADDAFEKEISSFPIPYCAAY